MKFSITKSNLLPALTALTRIVPTRGVNPILSGILCIAEDGELRLSATDLELSLTITIPAEIQECGTTVFPANFAKLIQKYSDSEIRIEVEANQALIKCGKSRSKLSCMSPEEFPSFPVIEGAFLTVDSSLWISWMRKLTFAAADQNVRPQYAGVNLSAKNNTLIMGASDTYRLVQITAEFETEDFNITIPTRFLEEAIRLADSEITLTWNESGVEIQHSHFTLTGRLIADQFPDFSRVIPKGDGTELQIPRKEFLEALDRCGMFNTNQKKNPIVSLETAGGILTLKARSTDGENTEEIPINDVEIEKIAFTTEYLAEPLKYIESEIVSLSLFGKHTPGYYRDGNALFLVVPVRVMENQEVE